MKNFKKLINTVFKAGAICAFSMALVCCSTSKKNVTPVTGKADQQAEPADTNRYAGLFYFANCGDTMYGPDCLSPTGDAWIMQGQTPPYSPYGISNFWGKPLYADTHGDKTIKNNYRYYFNGDPAQPNEELLDYHADLITRAGVDFIVLDFTNGAADFPNAPSYMSATTALCNHWKKRMERGQPVPKIAFFVKDMTALTAVENAFFNKYDASMFFNYLGKKLLLVADPNAMGDPADLSQPPVPQNGKFANYTARHCWALNNTGSCWQFKSNAEIPPPPFMYNGVAEQMCAPVSCAGTADGTVLLPGSQGRQYGNFFKKYVNAAINAKVKIMFVHSWNEWSAGNFSTNDTQNKPRFIDQWLTEYSSDIEPMAGGHGDTYYQLMKTEIAKFKQ